MSTETMSVEDALAQAIAHHEEGHLPEAELFYRAILDVQPQHPTANHGIGLLAVLDGKLQEALQYFTVAMEADPSQAKFWVSSIDVLIQRGQYSSARQVLEQGLRIGLAGPEVDALSTKLETVA